MENVLGNMLKYIMVWNKEIVLALYCIYSVDTYFVLI